jgi:hypothetical protein
VLGIAALLLTHSGFVEAKSDASLFIYHHWTDMAYLLLYVDDIVLNASNQDLLCRIFTALQKAFSMKDLGTLHHFLGVAVQQHSVGLFLSQQQYALDIFECVGMSDCKPCSTPVDTHAMVSAMTGTTISDPACIVAWLVLCSI